MATEQRRANTLPPKRGAVKAQIFESFKKGIASMASKAGEVITGNKGEASGGGVDGGTSASTTPPPSSYDSDTN